MTSLEARADNLFATYNLFILKSRPGRKLDAMKKTGFSWVTQKAVCLLFLLLAVAGLHAHAASAKEVHSIFVAGAHGGSVADAVRTHMIDRLRKSGSLHLVSDEAAADATLRIDAVVWPGNTTIVNPRSRSASVTNFLGYASAELVDRDGQPLWSYLATPSRFHISSTTADLADQLSAKLVQSASQGIQTLPENAAPENPANRSLKIAGATFPAPLYQKWFESFRQESNGFPVSYDAVGSAKGLDELRDKRIDVAASDIALDPQADSFSKVRQFPSVIGGVVPTYNLPGVGSAVLNFTPDVLALIYKGDITQWDDPHLRELNHSVHLPHAKIQVLHRTDGSGTTFIWTTFLSMASSQWKIAPAATVQWLAGTGVTGSEGMVDQVSRIANSIGYVELTYAIQHRLHYGAVRNRSGRFIRADLDSLVAAASTQSAPASSTATPAAILNSPRPDAYPIATFTWLLVPETTDAAKRRAVAELLKWTLTAGQRQCSSLAYAPLPPNVVQQELKELDSLQ